MTALLAIGSLVVVVMAARLLARATERHNQRVADRTWAALASNPFAEVYGFDLLRESGLLAGSMYSALDTFERDGLVRSWWAATDEPGRPRKRMYALTVDGRISALRINPALPHPSKTCPYDRAEDCPWHATHLVWECHVCGAERPDERISVYKRSSVIADTGGATITENVRYCNDRDECIEGAPDVHFVPPR